MKKDKYLIMSFILVLLLFGIQTVNYVMASNRASRCERKLVEKKVLQFNATEELKEFYKDLTVPPKLSECIIDMKRDTVTCVPKEDGPSVTQELKEFIDQIDEDTNNPHHEMECFITSGGDGEPIIQCLDEEDNEN